MSRVAAFAPDLMDRSRIGSLGDVTFVNDVGRLADVDAEVVVVDLTRPGVLDVLPDVSGRVIGFANHTERDLMDAARAAGCDQVLARSAFFARLPELLAGRAPEGE